MHNKGNCTRITITADIGPNPGEIGHRHEYGRMFIFLPNALIMLR